MSDALSDGRRIRVLNILDDYNREVVAIEAGLSIPAERVVRVLKRIGEERGLPQKIRVDNGPEFLAYAFQQFCKDRIQIQYIQAGKPTQNAYIERLNRLYREDVLDAYLFEDLEELSILSEDWRIDYNKNHPHKSLGRMSPEAYAAHAGSGPRATSGSTS